MPPRRCWREKGHHPREDSPPECRHRPKLHNSSTAAQTRMLSTGEFWARLGQPLACTSISSVVVVSAPTRRTTCLKLPSFRSRAACQVVRSSSAKNLSSQNTLESQGFRRMFKRYLFGTTFASCHAVGLSASLLVSAGGVFRPARSIVKGEKPGDCRAAAGRLVSQPNGYSIPD